MACCAGSPISLKGFQCEGFLIFFSEKSYFNFQTETRKNTRKATTTYKKTSVDYTKRFGVAFFENSEAATHCLNEVSLSKASPINISKSNPLVFL